MARFLLLTLLSLCASASAFLAPLAPRCSKNVLSRGATTAVRMSAEASIGAPTAESLRDMAQACQEDGCSVEAVEQLLEQLKSKKKELQMQLVTVDDVLEMMGDTSSLSEKGELEKLVMAVGRVFSTNDDDYPYLSYPVGYSGDVNKEKKDAWDYNVNSALKPSKPIYNK